jgi:hypothetical protein
MADATQELMLRVRGDNSGADKAIANTKTAVEGLKVSGEKAAGAFKNFSRSLAEARDASDVASSAANSLSMIVGKSLMGAFAVGGVKLFTDQINRMGEQVKATATASQKAFDDIEKAGQAMSLSEATNQVSQLDTLLASTQNQLNELNRSPFQNFIAGATGAKNAMEELVDTSKRLRDMKLAEGIATENANAEHLSGLTEQERQIAKVNADYEKRNKIAQTFTDAEAYRAYQEASAAQKVRETNAIIDKQIEDRSSKERAATDERRKIAMDEFQLDIDMQSRKTQAESKAFFEKLDHQKQELENAQKIADAQEKLNDLVTKRIDLENELQQAQSNETLKQGELATKTAGVGGSGRGAGQRSTSFENQLKKDADRAYQDEKRRMDELYDKKIADELEAQGKSHGKQDVQREKIARAEAATREKARKEFEDPYLKQIEKTTKALQDNERQINNQEKALELLESSSSSAQKQIKQMADAARYASKVLYSLRSFSRGKMNGDGGETPTYIQLYDIKKLLEQNFNELKAYAHAT